MDQHIINKTPSFSNPLLKKQLIKFFFNGKKWETQRAETLLSVCDGRQS